MVPSGNWTCTMRRSLTQLDDCRANEFHPGFQRGLGNGLIGCLHAQEIQAKRIR